MTTKKIKSKKLRESIIELHSIVEILNNNFQKKKFTLDGRLVGDIGEVLAEQLYQIEIFEKNKAYYDAHSSYGNHNVQIKCTFKNSLTFNHEPDYYIGLKLYEDGRYEEIYNGPGKYIKEAYKHRKGIGEKLLSFPIKRLKEISASINEKERIRKR